MVNLMVGAMMLTLVSAVGAVAQTPEQYRETQQELVRQFYDCVSAQAPKMDDGTSDASTIARGAVAMCGGIAKDAAVWSAGSRSELIPRLQAQMEVSGIDIGIAALLKARVARQRPVPSPATPKAKPKPKGVQI
jgi:hypothetical protein